MISGFIHFAARLLFSKQASMQMWIYTKAGLRKAELCYAIIKHFSMTFKVVTLAPLDNAFEISRGNVGFRLVDAASSSCSRNVSSL